DLPPGPGAAREHPLTTGGMTVHVVDNASTDGTADVIAREFPEGDPERLTWNSGFCIANNILLARTTAPYALVLNPDTVMFGGTLDRMVELMEQRPAIRGAGWRPLPPRGGFRHRAQA